MFTKKILSHSPKNILLITYGGHGDILLTTPLIASLKSAFPDATIDIYIQKNRQGMLEGNTDITNVFQGKTRHGFSSYFEFFSKHTLKYDLAVSVRTSDRQTIFSRSAGRRAIGLVPAHGQNLFWKRAILDGYVHAMKENHVVTDMLKLADILGIPKIHTCRPPINTLSEKHLNKILKFDWSNSKFAVMHLCPRNNYKAWTKEGWRTVAQHLISNDIRVVLVGGPDNREIQYAADIKQNLPDKVIDITGKTSFADVSALLQKSTIYLGPDTAMTHLAAVLKTPTIGLYGHKLDDYMPYHEDILTTPYHEKSHNHLISCHVHVLIGDPLCSSDQCKCEKRPQEFSDCMQKILPENVIAVINDLINIHS